MGPKKYESGYDFEGFSPIGPAKKPDLIEAEELRKEEWRQHSPGIQIGPDGKMRTNLPDPSGFMGIWPFPMGKFAE